MMSLNCGAGEDLVFIQSIMMPFEVSVWCLWTVVLEKTLEITLDSKETETVNPIGNQPWTFTRRTDTKSEAPIFWPPDAKNWLIGKDLDAGKDWRQEEKGWWRMRWLDGNTNSMDIWPSSGRWWRTGKAGILKTMGLQRVRHNRSSEQQHHMRRCSNSLLKGIHFHHQGIGLKWIILLRVPILGS